MLSDIIITISCRLVRLTLLQNFHILAKCNHLYNNKLSHQHLLPMDTVSPDEPCGRLTEH